MLAQFLQGFAHLHLYGLGRDLQHIGDFAVFEALKAAQLKNLAAARRQSSYGLLDFFGQFGSIISLFAHIFRKLLHCFLPVFFLYLFVLDEIQAAIPHGTIEIGFEGSVDLELFPFFPQLKKEVLNDLFPVFG